MHRRVRPVAGCMDVWIMDAWDRFDTHRENARPGGREEGGVLFSSSNDTNARRQHGRGTAGGFPTLHTCTHT